MLITGFKLTSNLFLRDPQSSDLGQSIIRNSIVLIDELGFDDFTLKKLGHEMGTSEASIYRYFENKHRILLYLIDWYWTWLDYKIEFRNQNIVKPENRLRNCIELIVEEKAPDLEIPFVDERRLQRIVKSEFEKTYLTKHVDTDAKEGLFVPYKRVCEKVSGIIHEINSKYPFPQALACTVMLSANHQLYFAQHLPALTEVKKDSKGKNANLIEFLESLVLNTLNGKYK